MANISPPPMPAPPKKVLSPQGYRRKLEKENADLKRQLKQAQEQMVPWYPPMETDPSKRVILGMNQGPRTQMFRKSSRSLTA